MDQWRKARTRATSVTRSPFVRGARTWRPHAGYADILDGDTLWLAVADVPGEQTRLVLQDQASPLRVMLRSEPVDVDGELRLSVREELTAPRVGLPHTEWLQLLLFAEAPSCDVPRRVRAALGSRHGPTRVPPSRDRRWQFAVVTDPGGLTITRRPVPPGAWLLDVSAEVGRVQLRLAVPDPDDPRLLLIDDDRVAEPVEGLPLVAMGEDWLAELDERTWSAAIARRPDHRTMTLSVGTRRGRVPVLRNDNVLRSPNLAVVMPTMPTDTGRVARLRFVEGGRLALTVSASAGGTPTTATDTSDEDEVGRP